MTNKTLINIEIDSEQPYAKVAYTTNSVASLKRIPVASLPDLIKDTSAINIKEHDTGFISNALVREAVVSGQVRRLYNFPVVNFTGNFKVYSERDFPKLNLENKYGFKFEDRHYGTHFVMPNFVLNNFGMYIVNANNEDFSNVLHQFGCISTNMFNLVDKDSKLHQVLLNHHDTTVCWHSGFDRQILSSKDTTKQVNAIHAYLNSDFNRDLNFRCSIMRADNFKKVETEELEAFVKEVFPNESVSSLRGKFSDDSQHYWINVFFLYFFCTLKGFTIQDLQLQERSYPVNFMEGF